MSTQSHAQDAQDRYFMMLAIEQAKRGLYTTRPNPAVGCVIVQAEQIVGQGFHPKAGEPHAEVFALNTSSRLLLMMMSPSLKLSVIDTKLLSRFFLSGDCL